MAPALAAAIASAGLVNARRGPAGEMTINPSADTFSPKILTTYLHSPSANFSDIRVPLSPINPRLIAHVARASVRRVSHEKSMIYLPFMPVDRFYLSDACQDQGLST